jgi:hypothetical protein
MSGDPDKLEQLIESVARSQPARLAPGSLQARVLTQIALQQAHLPWWRRGFAHWPQVARGLFLVASYGFIKLAMAGVVSVIELVRTSDVAGVETLHRTGEAVSATVSLGSLVLHAIPPLWLYGGAAFGFVLYVALFGLGTFAYRTLYVQR